MVKSFGIHLILENIILKFDFYWALWDMPAILVTLEAEAGGSQVQGQSRQS
jgi:hypothetical protein